MHITKSDYVIDIRLMNFYIHRVSKENNKVNLVMFNLGANLVISAQMSRKELMNI